MLHFHECSANDTVKVCFDQERCRAIKVTLRISHHTLITSVPDSTDTTCVRTLYTTLICLIETHHVAEHHLT